MDMWTGMDAYLQQVDKNLCSPNCPCRLTNIAPFRLNSTTLPIMNQWTLTPDPFGATSFQNCSIIVKANVYTEARIANPDFDPYRNFNQRSFFDYMANIENQFSCTGFCDVNYYNTNINQNTMITKYLFTDINR